MRCSLTILEDEFRALRAALGLGTGVEGAAYILCGVSRTGTETRLLAREVLPVRQEDYLDRATAGLSIASASYARIAKLARELEASVLFVHSHPAVRPEFSRQDNREDPKLMRFLESRVSGRPHGCLVVCGPDTVRGRIWAGGEWLAVEMVRVVGSRFNFLVSGGPAPSVPAFFDRQVRAFGPDIQRLLGRLHVGVVGAGGTGSAVAEQLARLGVGHLSVFDGDAFEGTNVNRVYGARVRDEGLNKAGICARHLCRIGLGTRVKAFPRHITEEATARRLRECDLVFGCTDTHTSRAILCQLSLHYLIPVFDMAVRIDSSDGVIRGVFGRVTTILPGEACLLCRERISAQMIRLESMPDKDRRALADEAYAPEIESDAPAVITFTTAVAAQAVSEFLHRLTGFMGEDRESSEVLLQFCDSTLRRNKTPANIRCVCAQRERWGTGDGTRFLGLTWPT